MPSRKDHELPYPVSRATVEQRALRVSRLFTILWPIVVAVVGLALVVMFVVVPSLRDPALIAALSGLFTVAGTVGLSRRESK